MDNLDLVTLPDHDHHRDQQDLVTAAGDVAHRKYDHHSPGLIVNMTITLLVATPDHNKCLMGENIASAL